LEPQAFLADRLKQARDLVDDAADRIDRDLAHADAIRAQVTQDLKALESQIFGDASSIIEQFRCVAHDIETVQLQEGVADAINNVRAADPGINILGVRIINLHLKQVEILEPDKAYFSLRDGYLANLAKLKDGDRASEVVSTYGNIIRIAKDAQCVYAKQAYGGMFLREQIDYDRLNRRWTTIVFPVM
jgi:hypothetical protein